MNVNINNTDLSRRHCWSLGLERVHECAAEGRRERPPSIHHRHHVAPVHVLVLHHQSRAHSIVKNLLKSFSLFTELPSYSPFPHCWLLFFFLNRNRWNFRRNFLNLTRMFLLRACAAFSCTPWRFGRLVVGNSQESEWKDEYGCPLRSTGWVNLRRPWPLIFLKP